MIARRTRSSWPRVHFGRLIRTRLCHHHTYSAAFADKASQHHFLSSYAWIGLCLASVLALIVSPPSSTNGWYHRGMNSIQLEGYCIRTYISPPSKTERQARVLFEGFWWPSIQRPFKMWINAVHHIDLDTCKPSIPMYLSHVHQKLDALHTWLTPQPQQMKYL